MLYRLMYVKLKMKVPIFLGKITIQLVPRSCYASYSISKNHIFQESYMYNLLNSILYLLTMKFAIVIYTLS